MLLFRAGFLAAEIGGKGLETGELVVGREQWVGLAVSLDLRYLEDRLPAGSSDARTLVSTARRRSG